MPSQQFAHRDRSQAETEPARLAAAGGRGHAPAHGGVPPTLLGLQTNPDTLGPLLARADAGTRERLATGLQRTHGNAAVQRLVAGGPLPVQRWRVGLPARTSDCATVVDYMNARSPHRNDGGWAKTSVRFNWGGDPAFTGSGSDLAATVARPTVTKAMGVDMPEWQPANAGMAGAWSSMSSELRAHEARHEAIGNTWETTLRENLTGLTVYPSARTAPAFTTAVGAEWATWLGQHQADQRAIDPYSALLDCPAGSEESADASGPASMDAGAPDEGPATIPAEEANG